jgi:Sulfatase-modifying factor enzyme 1
LLYLLAGHWVCISLALTPTQDCKKTDSNGSETPHSETPPSYRCNSSTLQVAGFVTSNGGGLANSPRAMSKIMPPMSNVKTRAIRKSRKNSFTGRGASARHVIRACTSAVKQKHTGKRYRLPTESEWEYAARSGGKDEIWAGTSDENELEDYAVFLNSQKGTASVGGKKPNSLGLHDMAGNVFEWVADCWHDNYRSAPTDGSAWLESERGNCRVRMFRGGSWNLGQPFLRASNRGSDSVENHFNFLGFRLAQDLD